MNKVDPLAIMEAIQKHKVTHLFLLPTVLYSLLAHPDVRKYDYSSLRYFLIAAAPVAPEKLREAVHATVELKQGQHGSSEEIIAFVKEHLGGVNAPKSVDFMEELPQSPVGKVLKRVLRDQYWGEANARSDNSSNWA